MEMVGAYATGMAGACGDPGAVWDRPVGELPGDASGGGESTVDADLGGVLAVDGAEPQMVLRQRARLVYPGGLAANPSSASSMAVAGSMMMKPVCWPPSRPHHTAAPTRPCGSRTPGLVWAPAWLRGVSQSVMRYRLKSE